MIIKDKAANILGGFLDKNKDYAVELCINNVITNSRIGHILITSDWIYETNDKKITLKWNKDENYDVRYNDFSVPYNEIMKCYEKVEKEDELKIAESVIVILKNGMEFDFICSGMRL